jgi:hypothetical protein
MRFISSGLLIALTLSSSLYLYASPRRTVSARHIRGDSRHQTLATRGGTLGVLRTALGETHHGKATPRARPKELRTPLVGHTAQGVPIRQELLHIGQAEGGSLAKVLKRTAQLVPGLLPTQRHRRANGVQQIEFLLTGWNLAEKGADLYIAPYAMSKFRRQIFLLNSAGIGHLNILPRNIWVNENGEFVLAGWEKAVAGAGATGDSRALDRLQRYMRKEIGTGG